MSDQAESIELPCTLEFKKQQVPSTVTIDCGANGSLVDPKFVQRNKLPIAKRKFPARAILADGKQAQQIDQTVTTKMSIGPHQEKITLDVMKLGNTPILLGNGWLRKHGVKIDFEKPQFKFQSSYCQNNCNIPQSFTIAPKCPQNIRKPDAPDTYLTEIKETQKKQEQRIYQISIHQDILRNQVPKEYHEYLEVFSKELADQLPPRRYIDHEIPLEFGKRPHFGPLYNLSQKELETQKKYIEEQIIKGFMRPSQSSAASPMIFVKKKDTDELRPCVDYRKLNEITVKDRGPLPLINETMDRLQKAKIYTKLDLQNAYNSIRIKEGDEWKTAVRTRYGLFEYLVMPFGLTNAPATFQRFITDVLREYMDVTCVIYLDDILIFSENEEEHTKHVKQILAKLQEAKLYAKLSKCQFSVKKTEFLGYIIEPGGITTDPRKIQAIIEWDTPRNVKDVQSFLGFANFYRRFIKEYSKIVEPLTSLTHKDKKFTWTTEAQKAFEELKKRFTESPILTFFDPEREVVIETDASDHTIAGVISQPDDQGRLRPLAFYSKKLGPAECNYQIYEKELLAIVTALKEWRQYVEGNKKTVRVITDHRNLEYFQTAKLNNRRQARWSMELQGLDFKIQFRPGKQGGKPDALTRRPGEEAIKTEGFIVPRDRIDTEVRQVKTQDYYEEIRQAIRIGKHQRLEISECRQDQDKIFYKERQLIAPDPKEFVEIIIRHHDHITAGHPGRAKTLEKIKEKYIWEGMRKDIDRYVDNCETCQRTKPRRDRAFGLLEPLPVPSKVWKSITLDYITGLPETQGYNAVLVVVDRLSKMAHYIPTTKEVSAQETAKLMLQHVWRLHGTPKEIISDRGPQFDSQVWKELCKDLQIKQKMSTAYHP